MTEQSKARKIGLWVLSGLLAALFLIAGGSKLAGAEEHVQNFARYGWPDWMRLVVGGVEVIAAVLLLIPRASLLGAGALIVVMVGATYTHLVRATGEGGMAVFTIVLAGLVARVALSDIRRGRERRAQPRYETRGRAPSGET